MKANMGRADRLIRAGAVLLIAVLYFAGIIGGTLATVLGVVALVLLVTSLTARCPGYVPLGLTTREEPEPPKPQA